MTARTLVALALIVAFARSGHDARRSAFAGPPRTPPAAAAREAAAVHVGPHVPAAGAAARPAAEHAGRRHDGRALDVLLGVGAGALEICCARAVAEFAGTVESPWAGGRG